MSVLVREKLKELRIRAGYTIREMAIHLGFGEAYSTYSSYERTYKKDFLPTNIVNKLIPLLVGKGEPPITELEVMELLGVEKTTVKPREVIVHSNHSRNITIPEFDIEPQAGSGSILDGIDEGGESSITDYWNIPKTAIEPFVNDTTNLAFVTVKGNSMEPELFSGEKVMVDLNHKTPTPDGIYVIWDGAGLVIKQIQIVPNSSPLKVKIISVNKSYEPYEIYAADLVINGRVIGKWMWK